MVSREACGFCSGVVPGEMGLGSGGDEYWCSFSGLLWGRLARVLGSLLFGVYCEGLLALNYDARGAGSCSFDRRNEGDWHASGCF